MLPKKKSTKQPCTLQSLDPDKNPSALPEQQALLLQELQQLANGLKKGNKLLLKKRPAHLECQFMKDGENTYLVELKTSELIEAIQGKCTVGILEGNTYSAFKNGFVAFAIHVKTKALYQSLKDKGTGDLADNQNLQVA